MRSYYFIFAFFFTVYSATGSLPIFSLTEYDPWNMVIGSDSPTFGFYNDSLLIFLSKDKDNQYKYYYIKANAIEYNDLVSKLQIRTSDNLKSEYSLSNWTDQPTIVFNFAGTKISVYGDLRSAFDSIKDKKSKKLIMDDNEDIIAKLPSKLRDIFSFATTYDNATKKEWMPDFIEVMFWPYEYAPQKSINWPKDWPDLNDKRTKKRHDNQFSVYLPSSHYQELISLLKTMKRKGAVLINDKKMAVSLRFPFPDEIK